MKNEKIVKERLKYANYFLGWLRGLAVLMLLIIVCEILSVFEGYFILGAWGLEILTFALTIKGIWNMQDDIKKLNEELK